MVERDLIDFMGLADPVSALTHLGGGLAYLLSAPFLLRRAGGDRQRLLALLLFLGGQMAMFFASGCYHSMPADYEHKLLWRHLDHSMIWWTISGTINAAYVLAWPQERLGRGIVWSLALGGFFLEWFFLQSLPLWVSPILYVGMGLTGLVPFLRLVRQYGFRFASPLLYGGLASITGAVFEAANAPNLWPRVFEAHELLHCFLCVGMTLFWVGIHRFTRIKPGFLTQEGLPPDCA